MIPAIRLRVWWYELHDGVGGGIGGTEENQNDNDVHAACTEYK